MAGDRKSVPSEYIFPVSLVSVSSLTSFLKGLPFVLTRLLPVALRKHIPGKKSDNLSLRISR